MYVIVYVCIGLEFYVVDLVLEFLIMGMLTVIFGLKAGIIRIRVPERFARFIDPMLLSIFPAYVGGKTPEEINNYE